MLQCLDRVPALSYIRPEGAFYVFCDFSKVGDATMIAKQILDEVKVAGIPGDGFGAPNYIRFSFAMLAKADEIVNVMQPIPGVADLGSSMYLASPT